MLRNTEGRFSLKKSERLLSERECFVWIDLERWTISAPEKKRQEERLKFKLKQNFEKLFENLNSFLSRLGLDQFKDFHIKKIFLWDFTLHFEVPFQKNSQEKI